MTEKDLTNLGFKRNQYKSYELSLKKGKAKSLILRVKVVKGKFMLSITTTKKSLLTKEKNDFVTLGSIKNLELLNNLINNFKQL